MAHVSRSFHFIRYSNVLSRSELQTIQAGKYYREQDGREKLLENAKKTREKRCKARKRASWLSASAVKAAVFTTDPTGTFKGDS